MFRESDHPRNLEVDSSEKQLQTIVVIENASAGRISVAEAAEALRRGERQVKQIKRRFDRTDSRWVLHFAAITSTRGSTTRTMRAVRLRYHFKSFLLGCAARIRVRTLGPIQVGTGIRLRIVRVASGMVFLPAGGTDAGRKPPRGWSSASRRIAVYVGSVFFQRGDVLGILRGSAALRN